jgi:CRISPR-associated protein Cas1
VKTLFIDRKNSELEIDRGRLIIRIEQVRPHTSIPVNNVDMLVVSASVQFSSTLLNALTKAGITAVFINPRQTDACTITCGLMHNNAERRMLQYGAIADPQRRLELSQELVYYKLRFQRHMLLRALRTRPDKRHALMEGGKRISHAMDKTTDATSISSLRGLEGAAAAAYFEAYKSLFAPTLQFTCRNRRPPRDPVNVILSLTYTLLHAEAVRTLFATGFDPLLGIYHDTSFGRESLACDLVEIFRAQADRWVWRLFADETLCLDHFSMNTSAGELPCILGKRGREIYYSEYSGIAQGIRRLMRRASRHWLARLSAPKKALTDATALRGTIHAWPGNNPFDTRTSGTSASEINPSETEI